MVIFGMFIFVMMLIVAGMAVDIMRFESTRTRLQATCDRGVLAAADLDQTRTAEAVVRDYFQSAGLLDQLNSVIVTETINSREVTASADLGMNTHFMRLAGVDQLVAPGDCTAREEVSDIEIVLVLDVSGSMGDPSGGTTKIALLRAAARDFVQTVMANDTDKRISIAIVPFNAQVNLGPTMFNGLVAEAYAIPNRHGTANSFCLDLPPTAYNQAELSRTLSMPQAGYFDSRSTTTRSQTAYVAPQAMSTGQIVCRTDSANIVRLPSQNVTTMRSQLQGLVANGNTSITMGMKWANFMLDPSSGGFYDRVTGPGPTQIPATTNMIDRPYAHDRDNTLKIVVVMTDGEHVSSPYLNPGYRTETANIWRTGTGSGATWSAFFDRAGTNLDYWVPSFDPDSNPVTGVPGQWMATPHNDSDTDGPGPDTDTDGASPPVQMTWNQVWANARMSWVAWTLYARGQCPFGAGAVNDTCRNNVYTALMRTAPTDPQPRFVTETVVSTMNSTLQQSCAQARGNGVIVYGIAFEAPVNGRDQIFRCASSPSHYYDAQGLDIANAFRAIAAQINALRLTN